MRIQLTALFPDGHVRSEIFRSVVEADRAKRRWMKEGAGRVTMRQLREGNPIVNVKERVSG
jgi:hypothetical protein